MQTKQTVSLQFLPEYNAYGISDKEVKKIDRPEYNSDSGVE